MISGVQKAKKMLGSLCNALSTYLRAYGGTRAKPDILAKRIGKFKFKFWREHQGTLPLVRLAAIVH